MFAGRQQRDRKIRRLVFRTNKLRDRRMSSSANRLLEGLPRNTRSDLLSESELVELEMAQVLYGRDAKARHVYFPAGSTLSLWTTPGELPAMEVAMVGNEGMLGSHIALGVSTAATFAQVQEAGLAWRVPVAQFKRQLGSSAALQRSIHRYLHVTILQGVSMTRCSRFHSLNQRLARWLLMTQDRAHKSTFRVTQELMSNILGVRRVGITAAAVQLQRCGVIHYARGVITIVDRKALEAEACSCYAADRRMYTRFLA
jgi:Crp-like helix-turn-helix domain